MSANRPPAAASSQALSEQAIGRKYTKTLNDVSAAERKLKRAFKRWVKAADALRRLDRRSAAMQRDIDAMEAVDADD